MNLLSLILSTILQLILFCALPFLYWRSIKGRKRGFFEWVGIKPIQTSSQQGKIEMIIAIASAVIYLSYFGVFILPKLVEDSSVLAGSQFTELSLISFIGILIYAFIQTGLSEEIFFRGFIGKFMMKRLGYVRGNIIQASLFGLTHAILFFGKISLFSLLIVTLVTGGIGYFMGYINEKKAGGSILPSWITHGIANVIGTVLLIVLM
ncbi:MAG: CPBP family intramembrane glutamic endopeptidase [Anaerorhabdus sp.]